VRYAGGGLDAFIVENAGRDRRRLVAAAVLAYQRAHGTPIPVVDAPATRTRPRGRELEEAQRSVLVSGRQITAEAVEVGLTHLSDAYRERFSTLAVAATGAELYRLGLLLRRVADHVERLAARDARADEERLLDELATACALAGALDVALARSGPLPAYLAGEARSRYEDVASIDVIGAGAYSWRTGSGYAGLTVLFFAPRSDRWMSWTDARPELYETLDATRRYFAPGPWPGAKSPADLAGSSVTLTGARVNRFGRIGTAEGTTAEVAQGPEPAGFRFGSSDFTVWSVLREWARNRTSAVGLRDRNPHDAYVVVRPARCERPRFDSIGQRLVWGLYDGNGDIIEAILRYDAETARAIARIEQLDCSGIAGVVGRLQRADAGPSLEPISLLFDDRERFVDVLAFGTTEPMPVPHAAPEPVSRRAEPGATILTAVGTALVRAAERGVGSGLPETLRIAIERAARSGLSVLGSAGGTQRNGERLLRLRYVYNLATRQ
jgi:hypothetical protein